MVQARNVKARIRAVGDWGGWGEAGAGGGCQFPASGLSDLEEGFTP